MRNRQKLITCIVREAYAARAAAALREKFGLQTLNHHFARGIGKSSPLVRRGIGEKTEKVVLSVVVDSRSANKVFEFLYHAAEINRPRGGLIFMNSVHSVAFETMEIPENDANADEEEEEKEKKEKI